MSDDKTVSQLISKSMRKQLNADESEQVRQSMEQNEEARKFAELSKVIQGSVVVGATDEDSPGLSADAIKRLKSSVSKALEEKVSSSVAGTLDQQVTVPANASETRFDSNARNPEGRDVVSRFQIIRRLGEGGLGNVFLARDKKLNRNVAIKEMKSAALESPMAWQRFHREAEITGHLEHPNVVPLYQFGEDRNTGEPFYAMRFVGKRTLSDAIVEHHDRVAAGEDPALGLHRLLSVFLDVCQAIAYAHSRGVVHRDIKPENVALDTFGQVIVLDWGLAKVLEDGELAIKMTADATLGDSSFSNTMHGDVIGTPLYMAPEQAAGQLERVDQKTDVYGLGAILFAILTGVAPHEKTATESGKKLPEILKLIAESESPRVSSHCQNACSGLEKICSKAMARKPHLRFDSASMLANAVEKWMVGQSRKKASYDSLRMEGRELRADLKSSVRDLERNVRFMSTLPPIQELVNAETEEDINTWRERLSTIFRGLLRANPDYRNVVYSRVIDNQFTELVRVERHSQDATSIRIVPRSRLRSDQTSPHIEQLMTKQPDEVLTSLVCDPMCERGVGCEDTVGLVAGVPVYDEKTEETYGLVMINCDIDSVLRRQLNRRSVADEIVVACDVFNIMMHSKDGSISESTLAKVVKDETPHFVPAMETLQSELESIDEASSEIYGARLWFTPGVHGIMYLLKQNSETT